VSPTSRLTSLAVTSPATTAITNPIDTTYSIGQGSSRPLSGSAGSQGLNTTAKAGIGMGSFLGIAIIFLIGFFWGKQRVRRRMPDHVYLSTAPPAVELSTNSVSATEFSRRPRTRLPHLEPPSEVYNCNAGEIYELPGRDQMPRSRHD
jgi:hypothetical protein